MNDFCTHNRASNKEIDYVIEQIMNGAYLYEPPRYTFDGKRVSTSYLSIYDVNQQQRISYSDHSQSPEFVYVTCQHCQGSHRRSIHVYLQRVYDRMLEKGLIEEYPEVVKVESIGFPRYYVRIGGK